MELKLIYASERSSRFRSQHSGDYKFRHDFIFQRLCLLIISSTVRFHIIDQKTLF